MNNSYYKNKQHLDPQTEAYSMRQAWKHCRSSSQQKRQGSVIQPWLWRAAEATTPRDFLLEGERVQKNFSFFSGGQISGLFCLQGDFCHNSVNASPRFVVKRNCLQLGCRRNAQQDLKECLSQKWKYQKLKWHWVSKTICHQVANISITKYWI